MKTDAFQWYYYHKQRGHTTHLHKDMKDDYTWGNSKSNPVETE